MILMFAANMLSWTLLHYFFSCRFLDWYSTSVKSIEQLLLKYSEPSKLAFIGELVRGSTYSPKMDHLVCFFPGVLALGAHNGLPEDDMQLAKELMYTCYQMYEQMPTGLSPEIVHFNVEPGIGGKDFSVKVWTRTRLQ